VAFYWDKILNELSNYKKTPVDNTYCPKKLAFASDLATDAKI